MHCWILFGGCHPAGISHKKLLEQHCVHIVQYSMYFDALCGVLMWYVCFKYVVLLRFVAIYAVMLWRHDFAQYLLSQAFLRVFPGHFYRCCMYCCYILSRRIQVSFPRICAIFPSNFDVLRALLKFLKSLPISGYHVSWMHVCMMHISATHIHMVNYPWFLVLIFLALVSICVIHSSMIYWSVDDWSAIDRPGVGW